MVQQGSQAADIQCLDVGAGLLRQGPAFPVDAVDPGLHARRGNQGRQLVAACSPGLDGQVSADAGVGFVLCGDSQL